MTVCPNCKSKNTSQTIISSCRYVICADCAEMCEALPSNESEDVLNDATMPFEMPCDNCAFRKGSPERENKEEWNKLLEKLKKGGHFYCHKGVPLKMDNVPYDDTDICGFKYPTLPDGKSDTQKMRLCSGYLRAKISWIQKNTKDVEIYDVE